MRMFDTICVCKYKSLLSTMSEIRPELNLHSFFRQATVKVEKACLTPPVVETDYMSESAVPQNSGNGEASQAEHIAPPVKRKVVSMPKDKPGKRAKADADTRMETPTSPALTKKLRKDS